MTSRRPVTRLHATALVVASMIGTGVFTTTGLLVAELGSPWQVLLVWLLGGVVALCGADVYAELGAMMPRAGGEYLYLRRAIHPAAGFLAGWVSLLAGFSAPIAASAVAFGGYLNATWPGLAPGWAGALLIALFSGLHMASVSWGARLQTVFTLLKVALVLGLIVGGLLFGQGSWSHFAGASEHGTASELAVGLVFVSFAYSGWNAAAYLAGEIEAPERQLPRALLGGTALVVALYLGLNLVFFYAAPAAQLAGHVEVGHVAARALFGSGAARALSLLIALALISTVSAMIMTGPRVYLAMARDGQLFRGLARRNSSGSPWASVALQGLLAEGLALSATFEQLLVYTGFTLSLVSMLTIVSAVVLRLREPAAPRPYRARAWPWSPIVFLLLSLGMTAHALIARPRESLAGLATLLLGLVIYRSWRRPTGRSRRRHSPHRPSARPRGRGRPRSVR